MDTNWKEMPFTRVPNEVLERVRQLKLNGTQHQIINVVWRELFGYHRQFVSLTSKEFGELTGFNERQISKQLKDLFDRKIFKVVGHTEREIRMFTINSNFDEWIGFMDIKEQPKENPKNEKMYTEVIGYLNEKTGKKYSAKSIASQRLINGRISDGYTLADFKHVIDVKTAEWLNDPSMVMYLRPGTLFLPSKFEGYLNQTEIKKPNDSKNIDWEGFDLDD